MYLFLCVVVHKDVVCVCVGGLFLCMCVCGAGVVFVYVCVYACIPVGVLSID